VEEEVEEVDALLGSELRLLVFVSVDLTCWERGYVERRRTLAVVITLTDTVTRLSIKGITIDQDEGWTEQAKDVGEVILISRTSGAEKRQGNCY